MSVTGGVPNSPKPTFLTTLVIGVLVGVVGTLSVLLYLRSDDNHQVTEDTAMVQGQGFPLLGDLRRVTVGYSDDTELQVITDQRHAAMVLGDARNKFCNRVGDRREIWPVWTTAEHFTVDIQLRSARQRAYDLPTYNWVHTEEGPAAFDDNEHCAVVDGLL